MKNTRIIAPLFMPAELRPEEFATYLTALAAWAHKGAKNLETLFQSYLDDTKSEDSAPARMEFLSFMFFECTPGIDFLASLHKNRRAAHSLPARDLVTSTVPVR